MMNPFEYLAIDEHTELADHVRLRGMRFLSPTVEWVTNRVFSNASDARWWVTHEMNYADMCHAMWLEDDQFQAEYERRNRTAFSQPEHLTSSLKHLETNRYHLFIDGRWQYSFAAAKAIMRYYRAFKDHGDACTVVAGRTIVFYCTRKVEIIDRPPFSFEARWMQKLANELEQNR